MSAPRQQLERTRGRILLEAEHVRIASAVQLHSGAEVLGCAPRGVLHLALTDRRVVLATTSWPIRRSRLVAEWPSGAVTISVTRRRSEPNLINLARPDDTTGSRVSFEWLRGHRPRDWAAYRFRL